MTQQVDNQTARLVIGLAMSGAMIMLFAQNIDFGPDELDEKVDNFLFAIGISIMGVLFFIMRKKNLATQSVESMEILFFVMIPVIEFIPILGTHTIHFAFFFPLYYGALIAWLLISDGTVMKSRDTPEQKILWRKMVHLWGFLMGLSIVIFVFYFLSIQ